MGQYYKDRKIGTCECMYYMRLEEAQELAKQGARDDDGISFEEYLKDEETRWRFPFPDEDEGIEEDCKYNKGFDLPVGDVEVNHSNLCFSHQNESGGHNVNVFIPCLHSKDFKDLEAWANGKISLSTGGAGEQFLTVLFNAIRDGKEKTIFSCARCGQQQRFGDDDVEKIKERALEYYKDYKQIDEKTGYKREYGNQGLYEYAKKIIERIK